MFLEASADDSFRARKRPELYRWVESTLGHHDDGWQWIAKMPGLSRARIPRLIGIHQQGRPMKVKRPPAATIWTALYGAEY